MNILKSRVIRPRYFKAAEEDIGGGGNDGIKLEEGDDGSKGKIEQSWRDDWRETYAGEDEKKLSRLTKYASPEAAFDAMIASQNKLSSGEYKSTAPFPGEGSDEEKATWRSENGIPDAADKYDLGLDIEDDDKEAIEDFLKSAHGQNLTPAAAKTAVEWFFANQEKQGEERAELDAQASQTTQDSLRTEWGNDYRPNINRIHGLLDTAPEGVKDKILNGRLEDGTPIGSDEDTLKFLIDLALQINPATTLVPGAGDAVGAITDEIASIEGLMGNKNSEYWKGPKADTMQARYRDLITARDRMK